MGEIKKQTLSGVKWTAIENFSLKFIQFFVGIILARMLTPADYGLIGMIGIFTAVASTFVDSGMGNALVRKQNATEEDYNTVFIFNIVVSCFAYIFLFFAAPYIAEFFNAPMLCDITRIISLNLIIGSFVGVQSARFNKNLEFKTLAGISVATSILSGSVGIIMAYMGYGIWALVYQSMCGNVISVIFKWYFSKWKPRLQFSRNSFNELFGYGSKLLASSLLHTIYINLTTLFIGKFYPPKALGFYSRGESWPTLLEGTIIGVLGRVTFPILAKIQDDKERLLTVYRKYIQTTSLPIFFGLVLLCALSRPLICLVLTEKWLPAVPYMQIFCFVYLLDNVCVLNLNLLQVLGRSDLFLRLEIIKKSISVGMLLCAVPFGVMAICIMKLIYAQIAVFINTYYTGKLFKLGYWQQMKDFGPYIIYSAIASIPAFLLTFTNLADILIVLIGSISALGIYVFILIAVKDKIFKEYIATTIRKRIGISSQYNIN